MIKEAFYLVQEGVDPIQVEDVIRDRLGMKGPFEFLSDRGIRNSLSYGLARTQIQFAAYQDEQERIANNPEEVFKPQPGTIYSFVFPLLLIIFSITIFAHFPISLNPPYRQTSICFFFPILSIHPSSFSHFLS